MLPNAVWSTEINLLSDLNPKNGRLIESTFIISNG